MNAARNTARFCGWNPNSVTHPRNATTHAYLDTLVDPSGAIRVVETLAGPFEVVYLGGTRRADSVRGAERIMRSRVDALL